MHQLPNNDFDQFMKGKLEDASVEAPAFLWNKIEQKLPPVVPWYSKYKYLLVLLCLGFSSGSSIFMYKHFYLNDKKSSAIALNKRLLKDEVTTSNNVTKKLSSAQEKNNGTTRDNVNSTASVASFYNNSSKSTTLNNTANEFAKKEERLKRFEVKSDTEKVIKNNSSLAIISKKAKKKKQPSYYGSSIATIDEDINNKNPVALKDDDASNSLTNNLEQQYDVTDPIVDPLRYDDAAFLTASIIPVKTNVSALSSREALRAVIEKDKLESLDLASQAAGVSDLNPNREKMLKNLKQFAGYSINKGFHVGAFIMINNVWLTKKQFSTDENTKSIKHKVQFGKAYGVNIGYDFTDRLGVELEWQISEQGQKYEVGLYNDNDKHSKDIRLIYTKFPVLLKYKQTFINHYNSKPIAVSFVVGPQFNFLLKQQVSLDGLAVKTPQYNKFEFGVLGGFDFDLYMMRYMYLTIGGRTGFGTSFKPGQPMSFQLGLTTQLNFRYAKKLK